MCLGQLLQFSVWCADKNNDDKNKTILHEDDGAKQFYSVRVANRVNNNQWAEFAIRELANFAPPVRYNNRSQ